MKKYLEIAKIHLKSQLAWRADTIFNMMFTAAKILFAYVLWGAIFEGRSQVAGFTLHSMLSYYIISSFLSQLDLSGEISFEISARIRDGSFSKYMVIPVQIEKYFIAQEAGVVGFYAGFDLIAAVLWVILFRIRFVITGNPVVIAGAVAMILLGMLFMVQLNYYLGLLTLKYEDVFTFLMIKNNFITVITGSIIPLVLMPESLIQWMKFFPFYYVTYLPSMLLIGRNESELLKGLLILGVWVILMELVNRRTYSKYRYQFDGVGI